MRVILPDGQITHLAVQPLGEKYSASPPTQINSRTCAIPSHTEGRFAIVTDVGHGMRWTRQRRARIGNRRAAPKGLVSDQAARRRTALFSPSLKLWRTGPSKPLVQTGRGRQSRVVLAPVAGVKLAEASRPD